MNDHDHDHDATHAPGHVGRHGPRVGRPKTRAEERIEGLDVSPTALVAELEQLKERLAASEQEATDNKAGWQRTMADLANFRRRTEQERDATMGLANELLLLKLLTIVDDFDRALTQMPPDLTASGWAEGIRAIDRKLRLLLESEGLTPLEAEGKLFDPHEHEAIGHEETSSVPDGTVVAELQRGYRIRDRVLRPALVRVAKNESTTNQTNEKAAGGEN